MKFNKKYIFLLTTTILELIIKQSNATQATIQKMVKEFENGLSQEQYRIRHKGALNSIEQVNNEANLAKQRVNKENEKTAINEAQIGYLNSIKCLAVAGDRAYKANQKAGELSNSEVAKQKVIKDGDFAKQGIAIAAIAAYQMLGAATESAGNYATQQIKESIKYITFAEQAAYSGLEEIKKLSILGIDSGAPAKKQGLKASNEAVEATGSVYYNNLLKSAKIAFSGIDRTRPAAVEDTFTGTEAAKKSPEASSAIQSVNNSAQSAAGKMSEGPSLSAVHVVRDGIIAAIKGTAAAIQHPLQALKGAQNTSSGKLLEQSIIHACKQAQNDIAYAAASSYQSIGIAGKKVGVKKIDHLEKAMSAIQAGREAAYAALRAAKFLAVKGLDNEETARQTGLTAAVDAVLTSSFAAYAQSVAAANIAFEVLKS